MNPSAIGTLITKRNLLREYVDFTEAAGVPVIPSHDLRHTAASLIQKNLENGLQ